MATCKACGAELKPGAKFCENCGSRVEVTPAPPAPSSAPAAPAPPTASAPVQSHPAPAAAPKPTTPPPTPPKAPVYAAPAPAQPAPEKKPFDKRLLAIPAAIVAVLVIAAAFMLGKGSSKPAESTAATPAPAASEAAKPTEAPVANPTGSDAGIYLVASLEDEGASMTRDELEAMGMGDWYVELREDGTGEFYTGEVNALTWKDGKMTITDAGEEMDFTVEGDTLSFDDAASGFKMKFTRTDAKPEIDDTAVLTDGGEDGGTLYPFDGGNSYDQLLNTTWYGWIRYEHYDGFDTRSYFDTDTYDCWGYIEETSTGETYFEVYQDGLSDTPVISMWVDVYDDHIEPILDSDNWVLDAPIPQEEGYNFSIYPVNDSIRLLWYPYENDEGQSCSVSFFMRLDGTEWDEANDELPPRYEEYKAALEQ